MIMQTFDGLNVNENSLRVFIYVVNCRNEKKKEIKTNEMAF